MATHPSLQSVFRTMHNAPYLFIGSGFSRRYCNSPCWRELLAALARETRPERDYPLRSYEVELEDGLTPSQRYSTVASMIEREYNRLFFSEKILPTQAHKGVDFERSHLSPFRIRLADIFSKTKKADLSPELQEELSDLRVASNHSVNGIITTNYDCFLEKIFPEFDVYVGQEDLIFSHATGLAEIYKIHGCCKKPESIVFTQKDYEDFEKKKAYLVSKLLSIFMENPVIFFGYSASDADIRGIFESIAGFLSPEHLIQLGERIVFVEYQQDLDSNDIIVSPCTIYLEKRNLVITQIKTSSYRPIIKQLLKIRRSYDPKLLRRIRKDLYNTVTTNQPQEIIEVVAAHDVLASPYTQDRRYQIIGFEGSQAEGHVEIGSDDVYRHVVLHSENIHLKSLIESWLPKHCKRCEYPLFALMAAYKQQFAQSPPDILLRYAHEHNCIDAFIPGKIREKRSQRRYDRLDDIICEWDTIKNGYDKILLLDEEELARPELWKFIQRQVRDNPSCLTTSSTSLKRVIRICDFVAYANAAPLAGDGAQNL